MKKTITILSVFFCFHFAYGQSTNNPFEIVDRLSITDTVTVEVDTIALRNDNLENIDSIEADSTETTAPPSLPPTEGNPFEIIESEQIVPFTSTSDEAVNEIEVPAPIVVEKPTKDKSTFLDQLKPVGKGSDSKGQLFGVVLLALIPIAILFTIFRSFFVKAYQNVINTNLLAQSQREFSGAAVIPMNIWYIVFWINGGVFLSLLMYVYEVDFTKNHLFNALICVGTVGGLIFLKHILLSFMASIFPITKEIRLYSYLLLVFGIILGVFLMPVNIAIVYAPDSATKLLIYSSLIIIALFYILRSFRALIVGNRLLALHKFHFLLYICAVEIAPLLILIKLGILYLDLNA